MVAVPTGLVATPISESQIDLDWDNVVGATGYDIERDGLIIARVGVSTYSDTGLAATTEYDYRVRAVDCNPHAGGLELTYLGSLSSNQADGVTRTLPNMNFGTPSETRTIIAAIGTRVATGSQITAVTIGGVSATIDANSSPSWPSALIARAVVPTGTSGDIVLTYSGVESGPIICGLYSADVARLGITSSRRQYNSNPSTVTLLNDSGDSLVAVAAGSYNGDVDWTWSGLTPEFTYDRRNNGSAFPPAVSGGHVDGLSSGPTTLTATASASLYQGIAAVSYGLVPSDLLFSDRFDCPDNHTEVQHSATGHTHFGSWLNAGGSGWSTSATHGILWTQGSGYNTEAWMVIQENCRITGRIIGITTILDGSRAKGFIVRGAGGDAGTTGGVTVTFTSTTVLVQRLAPLATITSASISPADVNSFEVVVEVNGDSLIVKVDGTTVVSTTIPEGAGTGNYVGVWTSRQDWNVNGFDYLKVEAL